MGNWDQTLFFEINRIWVHPWMDLPMAILSSWDFWWPFVLVGGILMMIFGGFRGRAAVICTGACIGMTDGVIVDSLKGGFGRPRPNQVLEGVRSIDLEKAKPRFMALTMDQPVKEKFSEPRIYPIKGISFPSGHASNNFALATCVAVFFRRWAIPAFIFAVFVSYSRIYVGSHYPLDVVVAALVGAGVALITLGIMEVLWKRFSPRLVPKLAGAHPSLIGS